MNLSKKYHFDTGNDHILIFNIWIIYLIQSFEYTDSALVSLNPDSSIAIYETTLSSIIKADLFILSPKFFSVKSKTSPNSN